MVQLINLTKCKQKLLIPICKGEGDQIAEKTEKRRRLSSFDESKFELGKTPKGSIVVND